MIKKRKKIARKPSPPPPKTKPKKRGRKPAKGLSARQEQIVQLICKGLSSKEIGKKLGLSLKTVEVHRFQILRKLKLKNTVVLVVYAIRKGVFKI